MITGLFSGAPRIISPTLECMQDIFGFVLFALQMKIVTYPYLLPVNYRAVCILLPIARLGPQEEGTPEEEKGATIVSICGSGK